MIQTRPTTAFTTPVSWTRGIVLVLAFALAATLALMLAAGTADADPTTFTVNSTTDPGNGTCDATECTLREAITSANANDNTAEQDTIRFAITSGCDATSGVCTISPEGSDLPDITEPVIIDGYSQRPCSANPAPCSKPNTLATGNNAQLKIELSGAGAGPGANGLRIRASDCVVRGMIINGWSNEGVEINGLSSSGVSGNRIEGNFLGTDATGEEALGNANGVRLVDDASDNVVGGTSAAARNVISGNLGGIDIVIGSNGNKIQGNYVGTDASGTEDLGNSTDGVEIRSSTDNVVGGTTAAARNVISGNEDDGVLLGSFDDGGNEIRGNYIGTDASGTEDLGNAEDGVDVDGDSLDNVVGGTSTGARNVISGNDQDGVELDSGANDRVQGNFIGTDTTGQKDLGNAENGVRIVSASNSVVGGTPAASANTIAHNGGDGVLIEEYNEPFADEATGNSVLRNSIYDNAELGIDLGNDGVTPNDPQDPDLGPNLLQNYPTITSANTPNGQTTTIQGTLNSTPNDAFTIQLFFSPTADPTGFGEGQTFAGQTNVTTNASGNATFSFTSTTPVLAGDVVTATATNSVTGDTSEFSEAVEVEDTTSPSVVSSKPPDGASGVLPATNVSVIFSEQMQASTINENTFKLFERVGGTLEAVSGEVSYNATFRRGVFDPDENLTRGARYVAKVTVGARDLAGNRLEETETIIFVVGE